MEKLLDLVYPPICMACKKTFNYNEPERHICASCIDFFVLEKVKRCIKCGRAVEDFEYCDLCNKYKNGLISNDCEFYFTKNYSLFSYNDITSGTIFNFKYGRKFENVRAFRKLFEIFYTNNSDVFDNIDLFIPVPMHYKKERKRGFNQAKVLAKEFSKIAKVKYCDNVLFRSKETVVQSSLTPKARHTNLENAFIIKNSNVIKDKTIMLIDDIYTSGSTIIKCSKALMGSGAKEIFSFTLSIAEEKEN